MKRFSLAAVTAGLALTGVALAAVGTMTYRSSSEFQRSTRWVEHTWHVIGVLERVASGLQDAESAQRGYLLTGETSFNEGFSQLRAQVDADVAEVAHLTRDNRAQQIRVRQLRFLTSRRLALLKEIAGLRQRHGLAASAELVRSGPGRRLMQDVRTTILEMQAEERALLATRTIQAAVSARSTRRLIVGSAGGALVALLGSGLLLWQYVRARNRAERELEREQSFLGAVLDNLEDTIIACDAAGVITHFNLAAQRLHGVEAGLAPLQRWAGSAPGADGETAVGPEELPLRRALRGERLQREELVISPAGVAPRRVQCSGQALRDDQGRVIGAVLAVHDLTAERRAVQAQLEGERRYRGIIETAQDAIFESDLAGRIAFANPAAAELFGVPADRATGLNFLDLVRPSERRRVRGFYRRQLRQRAPSTNLELPLCAGPRGEIWIGQTVQLRERSGEVIGFQVVARDVTARRQLDRLRDEFVSVVSHELRTPLTSIRGSLGLLASGKLGSLPAKGERLLEIANDNATRLARLVDDILDLQRLNSGGMQLSLETASAYELVERALHAVGGMAQSARVRIRNRLFADCRVVADPIRIEQVLVNLLSNAVKFSAPDSLVDVLAERRGGEMLFQVRDHGRGIPGDKLEEIFQPFRQVDSSDARSRGGTGLGLAITREIVRTHGGRIWAASEVDRGSTFFFVIPAAEAAEASLVA